MFLQEQTYEGGRQKSDEEFQVETHLFEIDKLAPIQNEHRDDGAKLDVLNEELGEVAFFYAQDGGCQRHMAGG